MNDDSQLHVSQDHYLAECKVKLQAPYTMEQFCLG
jgi:hypothetical protein